MIRSALTLAARGFHIFPCRPRDKRPATANGLKDATTDPEIIRAWWRQQPDNNIAIATGPASGIFVVDVDGLDAEATLRRFEAEYGALPATVEVITAPCDGVVVWVGVTPRREPRRVMFRIRT